MAQYAIKQSTTTYPLIFMMVDSTTHITGVTGLSPTVTLSKAGGSFASPAGAVTEIANGLYKVAGNATDSGTLGPLALHATAAGADPVDVIYEVVAYDPQDAVRFGMSALPNAAAGANGGLPVLSSSATTLAYTVSTVTTVTNQLAAAAVADAVLSRDVSNVESTAPEHSLATIVLATTEWSISGSTWTIYRTDGTTTHFAKTLAATAGANPITAIS